MPTVLFVTNAFPYYPGEQFIEDEIAYWAEQQSCEVIVLPLNSSGEPRRLASCLSVDLSLARGRSTHRRITSAISALLSSIFWREVITVFKERPFEARCYFDALRSVAATKRAESGLKKVIRDKALSEVVVYTYWFGPQSYAAALLKRRQLASRVCSRVHGYDLYEHRASRHYLPLKRQLINSIDMILPVCEDGKAYLQTRYAAAPHRISVSRLGVPIPLSVARSSESGTLRLLSVSSCVRVKRVDKIIRAIKIACSVMPRVKLEWTHIGGGPELNALKDLKQC